MGIKYEVTAVTGKYTDRNGVEKSRYARMGVVLETRNGLALKIEAIPVGWDGFAYLNEPRDDRPAKATGGKPTQGPTNDIDDDIPF